MRTIDDLPRLPIANLMGSFGSKMADQLRLHRAAAATQDSLARGRILHFPFVMPCTPEAAHEVLVTKAKSFEKSPGIRVLLFKLAGRGLFTSEGALWRRQRKLVSPIFQPAPLQQYAETMRTIAERAADALEPGQRIDIQHVTTRIAMSVVGKALFDVDTFDEADALGEALTTCLTWVNANLASPALIAHIAMIDATETLAKRGPARLRPFFERSHDQVTSPFLVPGVRSRPLQDAATLIDERIQSMIDDRRAQGFARKDLLTRLLTAEDPELGGARMSDKQVRDEAVTLFVAGHETTATALAWAFYLLAQNPEALARARAEADAFGDGPITKWEPERLAYNTRVFRETMRLYPPITIFPRRALEDVEIGGCHLPRRSLTFVSSYALHRRPDVFEDPDRFDPDRWLPEREAMRHKSSYLPFAGGPRFCIGVHFAMMEGPIVLATLLRRCNFEIDRALTIEEEDFATLRPRGGVPAVVRSRAA